MRLLTFFGGPERGRRLLEFRTGGGLGVSVLPDRGMDIAEVTWNGRALGWRSHAGFRHPALTVPRLMRVSA